MLDSYSNTLFYFIIFMKMEELFKKLLAVQTELKAPKWQLNKFGGYKYRSCEDILEAVKPLLANVDATITIEDELVQVGDRYYIKAIARFIDCTSWKNYETQAYAREEESKKGMDGSQITWASSSYARKYALNGLLLIDDTKDADSDEVTQKTQETEKTKKTTKKTDNNVAEKVKEFMMKYGFSDLNEDEKEKVKEEGRKLVVMEWISEEDKNSLIEFCKSL